MLPCVVGTALTVDGADNTHVCAIINEEPCDLELSEGVVWKSHGLCSVDYLLRAYNIDPSFSFIFLVRAYEVA